MSEPTYRRQFATREKASEYEEVHLASRSYSDLLWEIEKAQLRAVVGELRASHGHIDYLDFATGTGRVLTLLEACVDTATAIDVSPEMLELARRNTDSARLLCKDITAPGDQIEGRYDLITAFRFFLNAEPSLRRDALRALTARLKDASSLLVFNSHGNPFSHKFLMWPVHRVRRIGRGYVTAGNYLSSAEVRRLAAGAGLRIRRTLGAGLLSPRSLRVLSFERALRLERIASGNRLLAGLCVNQMYVAQREG